MSKTHLAKTFARMAEHHATKAAHHEALATHFSKVGSLGKAHDDRLAELAETVSAEHSAMAEEHQEMGEECQRCAKALSSTSKAFNMSDDDELQPLPKVSAINPAPHLRAIPRTGSASLQRTVAPEFQKLVALDEED